MKFNDSTYATDDAKLAATFATRKAEWDALSAATKIAYCDSFAGWCFCRMNPHIVAPTPTRPSRK